MISIAAICFQSEMLISGNAVNSCALYLCLKEMENLCKIGKNM